MNLLRKLIETCHDAQKRYYIVVCAECLQPIGSFHTDEQHIESIVGAIYDAGKKCFYYEVSKEEALYVVSKQRWCDKRFDSYVEHTQSTARNEALKSERIIVRASEEGKE